MKNDISNFVISVAHAAISLSATEDTVIESILGQLVTMSKYLGDPSRDYVILGEGNTSARVNEDAFLVKASGTEMKESKADNFVQVLFQPLLELLDEPNVSDAQIGQVFAKAKVDAHASHHPSMETVLHAVCLQLPDVNFVAHTHPTAINRLTCSVGFENALKGRLFPDEIVVNGITPLLIPYADPGLPLAHEMLKPLNRYMDEYGRHPQIILLQNHGLVALGTTAQQVIQATDMAVKTARILWGTYAFGGPNFLSIEAIKRIYSRPDEHYRQKILGTDGTDSF